MRAAQLSISEFRGRSLTTGARMTGAGLASPNSETGTSRFFQIRGANCPAGPSRRAPGVLTSPRALPGARNPSPRTRAALSVASHRSMRCVTQNAPDLLALHAAARVAADDALALAARTDHLTHLCGEDAGQCLRGMADATRAHAEDLDGAALFLDRCASIHGLATMIAAMEQGAQYAPISPVTGASVVVVRHQDAANSPSLPQRVAAGLRRRFQRGG